ncbi:MAG: helix-turn-helix domain-containing protein [Bacteroidales bacterium]|nr:helix-turn-helix domain-containing protein [Bacteroidales bacterium]
MGNAPEVIARQFLNRTNRHLFLTGRAGTGKTTFLREIVDKTHKKAVIAAPTGVAAINAGGVTLHSLFQLPFGSFVPSASFPLPEGLQTEMHNPRSLMRKMHMHSTKRRLLQELELLIIDEVSMLRADLLDAIDQVLRSIRRQRDIPFGGVQVLFIGDLLQLPPVVKEEEWMVLRNFYQGIYFFNALALQEEPPLYIELEKIYRQSDPEFISLLNHFRDNRATQADVEILNRYYSPDFSPDNDEGYIYLTTHNRIADEINRRELQKLGGKSLVFKAQIDKDFREQQYPIDAEMELREGAQVMFIKNDTSGEQRFFNGKIGTVISLGEDGIEVGFPDGSDPVVVEQHTWLNRRYKLDPEDNEIREEVLGSFTQYPLKLAWAVTVHKSQGLTFERAIIDVQNAFAPGQIYVALSRLVSLDGLVLTSPVPVSGFAQDSNISAFAASKPSESAFGEILEQETHRYVRDKLLQYFDFSDLREAFDYHLRSYNKDEKRSAKQHYKGRIVEIRNRFESQHTIAGRFRKQVLDITHHPDEGYLALLQARVEAALEYFEPRIREVSTAIHALIRELEDAVGVKQFLKELQEIEASFFSKIQRLRKAAALVDAVRKNEELTREEFASQEELKERAGMLQAGKKAKGKKGKGIKTGETTTGKKKKGAGKKQEKGASAKLSFEMFRSGKSVAEIVKERELAASTIESHLAEFIEKGELDVLEILDEEKVAEIKKALKEHYRDSITPVKKVLGKDVSFGEIKMVMAAK